MKDKQSSKKRVNKNLLPLEEEKQVSLPFEEEKEVIPENRVLDSEIIVIRKNK